MNEFYFNKLMWSDMKNFVADCRCRNSDDVHLAIRAYASTVTPEKCNNWIDYIKNYVNLEISFKFLIISTFFLNKLN